VLPNEEGIEGDATAFSHAFTQTGKLLITGIGFASLTIVCLLISMRIDKEENERAFRFSAMLQNFCSTGFAWCMFFGAHWGISYMKITNEEALLRVALALLLSAISFSVIFLLDKIADMDATGEAADKAIRTMVEALGILVGFSWEQSFDVATDYAVGGLMTPSLHWPEAISKLLLSALLCMIVVPAWRWFILPTTQRLIQIENENEEQHLHRELTEATDDIEFAYKDMEMDDQELDRKFAHIRQLRRKVNGQPCIPSSALKILKVTKDGIEEVQCPYMPLDDTNSEGPSEC